MASETIYDHPLYYDILFGWDRTPEADFYEAALGHYGIAKHERVLEVACGSGRVARLLAKRGWTLAGIDCRAAMVDFLRERAAEAGTPVDAVCADMTAFELDEPIAAAYNPMSSFRLIFEDAAAESHLASIARALRPDGVYVIDMDFLVDADAPVVTTEESWEMTRGRVVVRAENDGVHVTDRGLTRVLPWGDEAHLRGYTSQSFANLVAAVPDLEIDGWHPETEMNADGVSQFDIERRTDPPVVGRTIVVLRRT